MGFLSKAQRRLLWTSFVLLIGNGIAAARLLEDATWLFSLVVAGLVAVVLIQDDAESVRE
ncbi:hypothetical protein [Catelliglobosispora koreensis]|uniref:hypothetical protein n=1 Tax=Catelliglobosispora koreensis TaxID=129052 RepID=UPI00037EFCBF|nr:hypothetical protein [Catelliglobosispora koreensis]